MALLNFERICKYLGQDKLHHHHIAYAFKEKVNCKVEITDMVGQLVKEIDLPCNQNSYTFSINDLRNSMYIIKVINSGTVVTAKKIYIMN